jgi:hypothetical protein
VENYRLRTVNAAGLEQGPGGIPAGVHEQQRNALTNPKVGEAHERVKTSAHI